MKTTLCFLALTVCFLMEETDAQCKDNHRFNCKYLDTHFGICTDQTKTERVKKDCPKACNLCPVDGGWSDWIDWSSCNVTCDSGVQTRSRECDNPAPMNGGLSCEGDNLETKICNIATCPVHGSWDVWSQWNPCSVTCGGGLKKRRRTCTNPAPSTFGRPCTGNDVDVDSCNTAKCESTMAGGGSNTAGDKGRTRYIAFFAYDGRQIGQNTFIFPYVEHNFEFAYDKTTGIFTAPVAGLYSFTTHICSIQGVRFNIYKNKHPYARGSVFPSQEMQCSSATAAMEVFKGEQVYVGSVHPVPPTTANTFTGHLVRSYE